MKRLVSTCASAQPSIWKENLESVTFKKKKKKKKKTLIALPSFYSNINHLLLLLLSLCAHSYYANPCPEKEKTLITLPVTVHTLKLGVFGAPLGFVVPRNTPDSR